MSCNYLSLVNRSSKRRFIFKPLFERLPCANKWPYSRWDLGRAIWDTPCNSSRKNWIQGTFGQELIEFNDSFVLLDHFHLAIFYLIIESRRVLKCYTIWFKNAESLFITDIALELLKQRCVVHSKNLHCICVAWFSKGKLFLAACSPHHTSKYTYDKLVRSNKVQFSSCDQN